jgi:hypothetical protein
VAGQLLVLARAERQRLRLERESRKPRARRSSASSSGCARTRRRARRRARRGSSSATRSSRAREFQQRQTRPTKINITPPGAQRLGELVIAVDGESLQQVLRDAACCTTTSSFNLPARRHRRRVNGPETAPARRRCFRIARSAPGAARQRAELPRRARR